MSQDVSTSDGGQQAPSTPGSAGQPVAFATALIIGGAVAATAGAVLGTRALARRNAADGKVNSTMAAAITATHVFERQALKAARTAPSAQDIAVDGPAPTVATPIS